MSFFFKVKVLKQTTEHYGSNLIQSTLNFYRFIYPPKNKHLFISLSLTWIINPALSLNFKQVVLMYLCQEGTEQNKTGKQNPTPLSCPHVTSREPVEDTLVWQRGHLFVCLHAELKVSQCCWDSCWLSSAWLCSGIQRGRRCATQWWRHTSHLHPQNTTQASSQWQPERTCGSRATIMFEWLFWCSWKMQCTIEKSR